MARAETGIGRVRLRRGEFPSARTAFTDGLQQGAKTRGDFFWAGCAAAHCGDYSQAAVLFTSAITTEPGLPGSAEPSGAAIADDAPALGRVYRHRAYAHLKQGLYDRALADLLVAEKQSAMLDNDARAVIAWLLSRKGRWTEAGKYLGPVRKPKPAAVDALMAYVAFGEGRPFQAFDLFRRVCSRDRENADLLLAYGVAAYETGKYDISRVAWERARLVDPTDSQYQRLIESAELARIRQLATEGDYEAAIGQLRAIDPNHRAIVSLRFIAAFEAVSKGTASAARLAQLAESSLRGQGGLRGLRGQGGQAGADDPKLWRCLALLNAVEGLHEQAREYWERLLAHDPDDRLARLGAALAAFHRGDPKRALADLGVLIGAAAQDDDIGRRAVHAAVAHHSRNGDWKAVLATLPKSGPLAGRESLALIAEAAYRTGRHEWVLASPDHPEYLPWKALAWLRLGAPGSGPEAPEQAFVAAALADPGPAGSSPRSRTRSWPSSSPTRTGTASPIC
ncbi:tetratricopeptide repeat protein [Catenulispora yoronensis]